MARTQSACVQFSEYRLSEMISFKDIETKKKKKKLLCIYSRNETRYYNLLLDILWKGSKTTKPQKFLSVQLELLELMLTLTIVTRKKISFLVTMS